jgi:hypothetical protein
MPTRIAALATALLASLWLAPSALSRAAEENASTPVSLADAQPGVPQGDSDQRRKVASDDGYQPPRPGDYDAPSGDADRQRAPRDDAYHPPRPQGSVAPFGTNAPPEDAYHPPRPQNSYAPYGGNAPPPGAGSNAPYGGNAPVYATPPRDDGYHAPRQAYDTPYGDPNRPPPPYAAPQGYGAPYTPAPPAPGYGRPYAPPGQSYDAPPEPGSRYGYDAPPPGSYSSNEILEAGHTFFGSVSKGLAGVIEYAFQKQGRPNGYILGQDAGGAFVAGVRFGEGILYTRDAGTRRVYWQGPSIGWDAGAEGSKVMVLVYNLTDPEEIYQRFAGIDGSAYLVGGAGVTFQKSGDVIVAPMRAGVGLRLGANIGYLKYTRQPTWNPF